MGKMAAATSGSVTYFFSAGEASGDAYAAELIRRVKARESESRFIAVGAVKAKNAGATLIADSSRWGAVSVVESLRVVPRVWRGFSAAKRALAREPRGVFVPIDFGFINVRLARRAKELGWKVLYFIPPGSWRRDKQGGDLPAITDEIVTPFAWSADLLNAMGASAHFFGHPLKEMVAQVQGVGERSGLAILPGSRRHEIERNLAPIAEAIRGEAGPVRFAVASSLDIAELERTWRQVGGGEAEFRRDTYALLQEAEAAIVCSGTATLEAALCQCPMVVVYRGSKIMEIELKIRKPNIEFVSLPNILMAKRLVPELLQHDANPENIRETLAKIREGAGREAQLAGFAELIEILGPSECLERTADLLLQMGRTP